MVTRGQVAKPIGPRKRWRGARAKSSQPRVQWSMAELAMLLGWTVESTRDTLLQTDERRAKAGLPPVLVRLGRLWFITRGGIKALYPNDWADFTARLDQIADRRAGKPSA